MKKSYHGIFVILLVIISGIGFSSFVFAQEESEIPVWIKTAISFWVNGQISDQEFLKAIEYFVENEMIHVSHNGENKALVDDLQILQSEINIKLEQSHQLVKFPQIQQLLAESNQFFTKSGSPDEIVRQIEERWKSSDVNVPDSVAYNLIHNSAADVLRSVMETDLRSESKFKYAEIFVTNEYGAIAAQTHKTTDYRQNDEIWWQKAKQNGVYFSESGYDESAQVYSSDIAIAISDENDNFIGVLKAVINIESIINDAP